MNRIFIKVIKKIFVLDAKMMTPKKIMNMISQLNNFQQYALE